MKIRVFINKAVARLRRSHSKKRKITYNDLRSFGRKFAGTGKALVIYIEFPYDDLLPNADQLPHFQNNCERYYPLLEKIADSSYSVVVATGLIEHLKNPARLIGECHRIVKPGGKVYFSASSVFSVHRGPDDYFHHTRFGMQELMQTRPWKDLDIQGSCNPFKTTGILLQRILLQCETRYWIRPFVHLLAHSMPLLDRCIINQYCDRSFSEKSKIDSMMPSNLQVIATK